MGEDTALTANAEACSYALAVYNYAKASGSEAALAGAVEELGKLFVKKPAARPQGQPCGSQDQWLVGKERCFRAKQLSIQGKRPTFIHSRQRRAGKERCFLRWRHSFVGKQSRYIRKRGCRGKQLRSLN